MLDDYTNRVARADTVKMNDEETYNCNHRRNCFAHLKYEHLTKTAEQNKPNANTAKPKEVRVARHDEPTGGLSEKFPREGVSHAYRREQHQEVSQILASDELARSRNDFLLAQICKALQPGTFASCNKMTLVRYRLFQST